MSPNPTIFGVPRTPPLVGLVPFIQGVVCPLPPPPSSQSRDDMQSGAHAFADAAAVISRSISCPSARWPPPRQERRHPVLQALVLQ